MSRFKVELTPEEEFAEVWRAVPGYEGHYEVRLKRGDKHHRSAISDKTRRNIINEFASTVPYRGFQAYLAKKHKVSRRVIRRTMDSHFRL